MSWTNEAWKRIENKISRTSHRIGVSFPHAAGTGRYNNERSDWWTNGFWPGLLWLVYRENGDNRLRKIAEAVEYRLDEPLHGFHGLHHDVGFMWSLSAVANWKLNRAEASRTRALIAASHLAGRFNVKGNFIRAWPGDGHEGWAIIDCLMNLPLLYWASETTGDPRFKHIAMAHADMAIREFLQPDGSVHHIVCFDPDSGERLEALGGQGYSPDSAWARGTAWAVYGFALSYKYTKAARYLDAAEAAARFFLANLQEDSVPYWDFRAPLETPMPLDTSAAACAASGLLEMASRSDVADAQSYRGGPRNAY